MSDQVFDARRLKIEDVERELRRRLQRFCAPEAVLDRGPRGGSNIIDRMDAIDPATANEVELADLREWGPIIARVRTYLAAAKVHRNNIFALDDEEKIKAYDLSRGWPGEEAEANAAPADVPETPVLIDAEAERMSDAPEEAPLQADDDPPLLVDATAHRAIDVELATIDDVEAARIVVLQRLAAVALAKAGLTVQIFSRMAQVAVIQNDPDATPQEKRDATLEAEQHAQRIAAAHPYELARQLKAHAVSQLATIEQLRAYDLFEGWPT